MTDPKDPDGRETPRWLDRERDDALLLAAAVVLVPLTWRLLMGWSSRLGVSGFDAMASVIPVLQQLVEAGGDWSALVYRVDLLGGMKIRDAVGPFPPFAWLAALGLGTTSVFNVSAFLVQAVLAFLGVHVASDLARTWTGRRLGWAARMLGVWFLAFAPPLGWRFGYGHLTLMVGLLPFVSALALVVAAATGALSVSLVAVALLAVYIGVLFTGHQLVLYGAVFGAPIVLGAWWTLGRRPRALLLPGLVAAIALGLALPKFLPVLTHARSSDSPRELGRTAITYSYLTERPVDVLGSLPWNRAAVPGGQPELHHHETNVPMGPLLVLLVLVPWKRARGLGVGLLVSAAAALLFCMNVRPGSTALLAILPPLRTFRVPTRALLPFALTLPMVTLAASALRPGSASRRATLAAGAVGLSLFWWTAWLRDAAGLAVALALVARRRGRQLVGALPTVGVLCALAAGGLAAFRQRLLPFPEPAAILARAQDLGRRLKDARPELQSPLVRVSLGFEDDALGPNTAYASGLSALDGYYFPSRRYIELFCALHGYPYLPNALLLRYPASEAWTRPAFALYNVGWFLERTPDGRLTGRRLAPTAGPAWFSQGFETVPSFSAFGRVLLEAGTGVPERVRRRLWLVASDPSIPADLPARTVAAACVDARVLDVSATPERTGVRVRVETPADCPLAVAMNFAETLRAEATGADGRSSPATVFPACGALAGVWVPAGTREILVEARP